VDNRTYNKLLRAMRALGERGFALLVGRWRVLQHVTASPSRIGQFAKAALVLTTSSTDTYLGEITSTSDQRTTRPPRTVSSTVCRRILMPPSARYVR
jgi:hypothetical protein